MYEVWCMCQFGEYVCISDKFICTEHIKYNVKYMRDMFALQMNLFAPRICDKHCDVRWILILLAQSMFDV